MSNSERRITASHTMVSDFAPTCSCGKEAVVFFEIHWVDYCTPDQRTLSRLACRECLRIDMERVQNILINGETWCSSCGLTMVAMSDMVVKLCPLWAIGD